MDQRIQAMNEGGLNNETNEMDTSCIDYTDSMRSSEDDGEKEVI
jgi:hypothetical protein